MRFIALIVCLALAMPVTCLQAAAQERTDVELVFLADASRSIDDAEIAFQRQGYAAATDIPTMDMGIAWRQGRKFNATEQLFHDHLTASALNWEDCRTIQDTRAGLRPHSPGYQLSPA